MSRLRKLYILYFIEVSKILTQRYVRSDGMLQVYPRWCHINCTQARMTWNRQVIRKTQILLEIVILHFGKIILSSKSEIEVAMRIHRWKRIKFETRLLLEIQIHRCKCDWIFILLSIAKPCGWCHPQQRYILAASFRLRAVCRYRSVCHYQV